MSEVVLVKCDRCGASAEFAPGRGSWWPICFVMCVPCVGLVRGLFADLFPLSNDAKKAQDARAKDARDREDERFARLTLSEELARFREAEALRERKKKKKRGGAR